MTVNERIAALVRPMNKKDAAVTRAVIEQIARATYAEDPRQLPAVDPLAVEVPTLAVATEVELPMVAAEK